MLYLVAGIIILVGMFAWTIARTQSLNKEPRQQILAERMMQAVLEGRADVAAIIAGGGTRVTGRLGPDGSFEFVGPRTLEFAWKGDVVPYFVENYGQLTFGRRQTRAAHALSMIRSRLTADEYELLSKVYCKTLPMHGQ